MTAPWSRIGNRHRLDARWNIATVYVYTTELHAGKALESASSEQASGRDCLCQNGRAKNPPPPSSAVAPPSPPQATFRDQDDEAWEQYANRETDGEYSWTYDGTTVRYRDSSWQFHEPETYRPKKVDERFYNELSPDHVNRLLSKKHLEQAAHVAYMRRKQSDEARALADLLTRQCIETYRKRCAGRVFQWRAKLLIEQGLAANAIELLTQRLDICQNESEREALLKALRGAERKARQAHSSPPATS